MPVSAATLTLWHLRGIWKSTSPFPIWPCRWLLMTLPRVGAQVCPVPQGQGGRRQCRLAGSAPLGAASPAGEHSPSCPLACTESARSQQGQTGTARWD